MTHTNFYRGTSYQKTEAGTYNVLGQVAYSLKEVKQIIDAYLGEDEEDTNDNDTYTQGGGELGEFNY